MYTIQRIKRLKFLPGVLLLANLSACEIQVDSSLPGVPATGLFAAVGANQHSGEDSVQVGVAIFDDGDPIELVGGDVVQASTANDSILLLDRGFYTGSYSADLPNASNLDQVEFTIVHEPLEARQDRWYPVDLLNIDPGPGELVGDSAVINLPPEPVILAPAMDSIFSSINDNVVVTWNPLGAGSGDIMKIRSAITCDNGTRETTYGTDVDFVDGSDDGFETVPMERFIYDVNDENPLVKFLDGEARAMLQELLEKLSNGAADDSFFANITPVNPITSECEIQMFLFRQRPGSFSNPSTDGTIFGGRSAEVTIHYSPI